MKKNETINICEFEEDADELEFWILCNYTCKMISHLRNKIRVEVGLSPIPNNNEIIRDQDRFYIFPTGTKKNRMHIKKSINGFCSNHSLPLPTWPSNF
jgi:hypothetical protein